MHLRDTGCSSPTTSCGTPAILRRSSCEGCAWVTSQVRELSYTHSRDVTCATLCQGPYEESVRYRDFMGWEMPCYSAQGSLDTLLVGRRVGMSTSFATCDKDPMSSRLTGRRCATSRRWITATRLLDPTVYGRRCGRTRRPAGHDGLKASKLPVPMDVPPASGLA